MVDIDQGIIFQHATTTTIYAYVLYLHYEQRTKNKVVRALLEFYWLRILWIEVRNKSSTSQIGSAELSSNAAAAVDLLFLFKWNIIGVKLQNIRRNIRGEVSN